MILDYCDINEENITKNADVIDWLFVSKYIEPEKYSMEFFEKFKNYIYWYDLSKTIKIPEQKEGFMTKYKNFFDPHALLANNTITSEVINQYSDELGFVYWYVNGKLHREDGPAVISIHDKSEYWYKDGDSHRLDGPASINRNMDGTISCEEYFVEGMGYDKKTFYKKYYDKGRN